METRPPPALFCSVLFGRKDHVVGSKWFVAGTRIHCFNRFWLPQPWRGVRLVCGAGDMLQNTACFLFSNWLRYSLTVCLPMVSFCFALFLPLNLILFHSLKDTPDWIWIKQVTCVVWGGEKKQRGENIVVFLCSSIPTRAVYNSQLTHTTLADVEMR